MTHKLITTNQGDVVVDENAKIKVGEFVNHYKFKYRNVHVFDGKYYYPVIYSIAPYKLEGVPMIEDTLTLGEKIVKYCEPYVATGKYNDVMLAIEFGYKLGK